MRGLETDVGARTIIAGHAFVQNIHRGHYELAADALLKLCVATAFDALNPDQQTTPRGDCDQTTQQSRPI
jgi:hypothetical protein